MSAVVTAVTGLIVLAFAYHLKRSSEIRTGVISGLMIILGMFTAEWLRSFRMQVVETRSLFYELISYFESFLYNLEDFMDDQYLHDNTHHMDDFGSRVSKYRRTQSNTGMPVAWTKKPSN